MRRALVVARVVLESAGRGLVASPVPSAIAVVTIAIALVLVGAFALVVGNMEGVLTRFASELHVTAYLEPGLSPDEQRALARAAELIEGVASVELVTPEQALERFRATMRGSELLAGLEDNPLPPSIELELTEAARTGEGVAVVAAALDGLPGVDELAHGQDWVEGYARAAALARSAATLLGAVLVGAALLIVANTIRLGVYAREDEIEILSLVGAGRGFVRAPFVLEGAAQGALGGGVALAVLWLAFRSFLPRLSFGLALFLGDRAPAFFAGR
ncbi:MAG: permease-like cell division protein FtsX, partial [Myxococcales bacterium]|nr:permease-like cell division protein FtsX [Myxococcales bacterium]